jgi:hypothetical protein
VFEVKTEICQECAEIENSGYMKEIVIRYEVLNHCLIALLIVSLPFFHGPPN